MFIEHPVSLYLFPSTFITESAGLLMCRVRTSKVQPLYVSEPWNKVFSNRKVISNRYLAFCRKIILLRKNDVYNCIWTNNNILELMIPNINAAYHIVWFCVYCFWVVPNLLIEKSCSLAWWWDSWSSPSSSTTTSQTTYKMFHNPYQSGPNNQIRKQV